MPTLFELWKEKKVFLMDKTLSQIINFSGEGELKDGNNTSAEIREFLNEIPSKKLIEFAYHCLNGSFKDSGFALQDVVNQFGKRIGFNVEEGLYRGTRNQIGYDGIWKLKNEHSFIVEIKTTDAYRINLDTIADYKEKLIDAGRIDKNDSSVLIIVGRQDTGDLEAQIRGSKHAWNVRLLSIEALIKLLELRETVNDTRILRQINSILKPLEYTRLDKLIDLLFLTSQDNQLEVEEVPEDESITNVAVNQKSPDEKASYVNFHEECIDIISSKLNKTFIKQSKSTYRSSDSLIGLTCAVSRAYPKKHSEGYWYAFHPHQKEFLEEYSVSYVSFGCGSKDNILLIPLDKFLPLTDHMNKTTTNDRLYWHVRIHKTNNHFEMELTSSSKNRNFDITDYLIK
jgi:hypothetical protein